MVWLRIMRLKREQRILIQMAASLLLSSSNKVVSKWISAEDRYSSSQMCRTWDAYGYFVKFRFKIAFSSSSTSVYR